MKNTGTKYLKSQSPTATVFDEISSYWAEMADSLPTEKQINFVKGEIRPLGLVLDLGCGSGRHVIGFSRAGYGIVGIDFSLRLLQMAKRKAEETGLKSQLVRADMQYLPFRSNSFAATVSLDTSFGYFPTEEDDLQSLREVSRAINEKGILVLDVFNQDWLVSRYGKRFRFALPSLLFCLLGSSFLARLFKWREYPSFYLLQQRSVRDGGDKLRDMWVFRDKRTGKITFAKHQVRLYSVSHLDALLRNAGLRTERIYGNYEGDKYEKDSSRLIVISRKA